MDSLVISSELLREKEVRIFELDDFEANIAP